MPEPAQSSSVASRLLGRIELREFAVDLFPGHRRSVMPSVVEIHDVFHRLFHQLQARHQE